MVRTEQKSGASVDGRPELKTILDFINRGETLVVTRIDRLARSLNDLQTIVMHLKYKGAHLAATEQPLDTSTAAGKAFFDMLVPDAWIMIARKNRHRCATCPADIHRKAAALPMTFQCAIHGYGFARGRWGHFARHVGSCTVHGAPSACRSGCCCSGLLGPRGRAGAFGAGRDARLFDNTAPPGFATECLGATPVILGARRDYHAFLTTPIIRQALTVIVPQYDRVAVERQPPCPRATTILAGSEAAEVGVFFSFPG